MSIIMAPTRRKPTPSASGLVCPTADRYGDGSRPVICRSLRLVPTRYGRVRAEQSRRTLAVPSHRSGWAASPRQG